MACIACGEYCDYCDNPDQKGKPYYRIFTCSYMRDLWRFIEYADKRAARIISVGQDLFDNSYIVTYKHTEELEIEVWT